MPVQRQSFSGQSFSSDPTVAPRLPIVSVLNFEYLAHPGRWDLFEVAPGKYEALPVLRTVSWQGGHNGIKPYRSPPAPGVTGNAMPYVATQIQAGWHHVSTSTEVVAFGETRTGYTHGFQVLNGDWHFTNVWRRPYLVGDTVHWDRDDAGYFEFLRQVAKMIGPIDANVMKGLRSRIEAMHSARRKVDPEGVNTEILAAKVAAMKPVKRRRAAKPRAEAPSA